jgi:DNA binding domain, excisionase family
MNQDIQSELLRIQERLQQLEDEMLRLGPVCELEKRLQQIESNMFEAKQIYTIKGACELLQSSQSQLYKLVRKGLIPYHKPHGRIFFLKEELVEWIRQSQRRDKVKQKIDKLSQSKS